MHKDALAYLETQRVCVFAIEMMDGSPHASTVHFACVGEEPILVFETDKRYRKYEALSGRPVSRASISVGFEEGKSSKTLQMDGAANLVEAGDALVQRYLEKFPEKVEKAKGGNVVFFKFTPTWWRFTDWSKPGGKTIYLSDGSVTVGK